MRQETVNVYKFEELPEKVQQKLIDEHRYTIVENEDWWQYIADEIEGLGGNLIEFDVNKEIIKIDIDYPIDFAKAIVSHHGKDCNTYILSEDFINGEISGKEYVKAISQEYLLALRGEYDYLTDSYFVKHELFDLNRDYLEDGRPV